jgi:hypothetical protein
MSKPGEDAFPEDEDDDGVLVNHTTNLPENQSIESKSRDAFPNDGEYISNAKTNNENSSPSTAELRNYCQEL